jgi:hypothetical protein
MWAEEGENGNQICEGLITKRDGDGRFGEGQGGRIVKHLDRGIGGVGGFRVKILEGQLPPTSNPFCICERLDYSGKAVCYCYFPDFVFKSAVITCHVPPTLKLHIL